MITIYLNQRAATLVWQTERRQRCGVGDTPHIHATPPLVSRGLYYIRGRYIYLHS